LTGVVGHAGHEAVGIGDAEWLAVGVVGGDANGVAEGVGGGDHRKRARAIFCRLAAEMVMVDFAEEGLQHGFV
jgi:hypothetical protein